MLAPQEKTQLYDALGVSASAMNILEAIEADQLVLVEGRTDALYVQALQAKRQSLVPAPHPRQVAFWSINGISDVSHKLKYWRDIFSSIKNSQTLWEKAVLLLDSDYLDRQEMTEVSDKVQEKFGITCYWLPSYTLESSLLLNPSAFEKAVSRAFSIPEEQVHEQFQQWQQEINIEDRQNKIEAQRRTRIGDFRALDSRFLSSLCEGNHYASYLRELESDAQQLARLATKEDVNEIVRACAGLSDNTHFEALSDEALLLHVIGAAERRFWFSEWTSILQAIYG